MEVRTEQRLGVVLGLPQAGCPLSALSHSAALGKTPNPSSNGPHVPSPGFCYGEMGLFSVKVKIHPAAELASSLWQHLSQCFKNVTNYWIKRRKVTLVAFVTSGVYILRLIPIFDSVCVHLFTCWKWTLGGDERGHESRRQMDQGPNRRPMPSPDPRRAAPPLRLGGDEGG